MRHHFCFNRFINALNDATQFRVTGGFCDDFEQGNLTKWPEQNLVLSGTVAATKTGPPTPFAGSYMFHAHGGINPPADGGVKASTATASALPPPFASGLFAFRAYVYVPQPLSSSTSIIKLRHQDSTTFPDDTSIKASGDGKWYANTDNVVANDSIHTASSAIIVGRWFCFEWNVTIGAKGRHALFIEGAQVIDAAENTVGTTTAGYDEVQVGFVTTLGGKVQDIYFDDVAIATHHIGCE